MLNCLPAKRMSFKNIKIKSLHSYIECVPKVKHFSNVNKTNEDHALLETSHVRLICIP